MQNRSEMASQKITTVCRVSIDINSASVEPKGQPISEIQIVIKPKVIVWTQDIVNQSGSIHQGQPMQLKMDQISFRYETEMFIHQKIMDIYRHKLQAIRKQKEDIRRVQQEKMELQRKRQQERLMRERQRVEDLAKRQEQERIRRQLQEKSREKHRKEQQERQKKDSSVPKNISAYKAVGESNQNSRPLTNNIFGRIEANPNPASQNRNAANPVNNSTLNRGTVPQSSNNIFGRGPTDNRARSSQEIATYQRSQNNQSNQNRTFQRDERQPASSIDIFQTGSNSQPTNFSLTNNLSTEMFKTKQVQQSQTTSLFAPAPANNNNNNNNRNNRNNGDYSKNVNKNKKNNDRIY